MMPETADQQEPPEWVTLVSSDGYEFVILRKAAVVSGTMKRMLDQKSGFREAVQNRCEFDTISAIVLEKVCEYLYFNVRYEGQKAVPDMELPAELSLELALAADYLDC